MPLGSESTVEGPLASGVDDKDLALLRQLRGQVLILIKSVGCLRT